jgi:hypothetical protein
MATFQLNIGLLRSGNSSIDPYAPIEPAHAVAEIARALREAGAERLAERVDTGAPEATIITLGRVPADRLGLLREHLYVLAQVLDQDCIALYWPAGAPDTGAEGELIGPRAADWGAFNADYFITF